MAGGICIGSFEAFPGAFWGENSYIIIIIIICFFSCWLSGLLVPCSLTPINALRSWEWNKTLLVGRISMGGWNDQDKSSGVEEQRGKKIIVL